MSSIQHLSQIEKNSAYIFFLYIKLQEKLINIQLATPSTSPISVSDMYQHLVNYKPANYFK